MYFVVDSSRRRRLTTENPAATLAGALEAILGCSAGGSGISQRVVTTSHVPCRAEVTLIPAMPLSPMAPPPTPPATLRGIEPRYPPALAAGQNAMSPPSLPPSPPPLAQFDVTILWLSLELPDTVYDTEGGLLGNVRTELTSSNHTETFVELGGTVIGKLVDVAGLAPATRFGHVVAADDPTDVLFTDVSIRSNEAPVAQTRQLVPYAISKVARDEGLAQLLSETTASLDQSLHGQGLDQSLALFVHPVLSAVERATTITLPPSPPPEPPSAPPPSPPPSPPSPPAPPPGLCTDTCNELGGIVGECNDGGPGDTLKNVACDYGTDCTDCGVRIFCVDCPEACQKKAVEDPANACMQAMWNDGTCDACTRAFLNHEPTCEPPRSCSH